MATLLVAAMEPHGGATTVAVGLARRVAASGRSVRIERIADASDPRAEGDASLLASIEGVASSGSPIERPGATTEDVVILEAPAGADASALADSLGAKLVLVVAPGAGAPAADLAITNHARRSAPRALPEDRLLAAPSVGELGVAAGARVLARSAVGDAALCEHIVIGAVGHDSDEAYFGAFPSKAVVTRAEKVDIALAALRTDTACLILTGGQDPSPYLLDRVASSRDTTLLLAPEGTVETVRDIEASFGRAPLGGEAKVERAALLIAAAIDDQTLEALLA